jgi:hypothetical protein
MYKFEKIIVICAWIIVIGVGYINVFSDSNLGGIIINLIIWTIFTLVTARLLWNFLKGN